MSNKYEESATVSKAFNHLLLIAFSISWGSGLIGKSFHPPCIYRLQYSTDGVHQGSSHMIFLIVYQMGGNTKYNSKIIARIIDLDLISLT